MTTSMVVGSLQYCRIRNKGSICRIRIVSAIPFIMLVILVLLSLTSLVSCNPLTKEEPTSTVSTINNNDNNGTFATWSKSIDPIFKYPGMDMEPYDEKNRRRKIPDITVGVYYYPWHQNDFHNGQGYLRDYLVPRQEPYLGEYDDSDPAVIAQHLKWSRQANIKLWITAWFGPNDITDTTVRNVILQHSQLHNHQIAIHYETNNRIKKRNTTNTEGEKTHYYTLYGNPDNPNDEGVAGDMKHFCQYYFTHPNYYTINGQPVIVIYLTRQLTEKQPGVGKTADDKFEWKPNELLQEIIKIMKQTTKSECGLSPYIIGDHIFNSYNEKEDSPALDLLDAITNYDVYGHTDQDDRTNADGHGGDDLKDFFERQEDWKKAAGRRRCGYIPAVSPGFNDRGVRIRTFNDGQEKLSLSRRLYEGYPEGSLFAKSLEYARNLVDKRTNYLMFVTTWNEFHEDTQIEPVIVDRSARTAFLDSNGSLADTQDIESTNQAWNIWNTTTSTRITSLEPEQYTGPNQYLTQGLVYEAYGDLYLNILRNGTAVPLYTKSFENFDAIETDVVKLNENVIIHDQYVLGTTGSRGLKLQRQNREVDPRMSIEIDHAFLYDYLIIDFKVLSESALAGEKLVVGCYDESGTLWDEMSTTSFELGTTEFFGTDYLYGVTECNITSVAFGDLVTVDFQLESTDEMSSLFLDDITITGLEASSFAEQVVKTTSKTKEKTTKGKTSKRQPLPGRKKIRGGK